MVKMTKGADIAWATGPKKRMKKFAHPVGGSYNIGAQQPQRWNSGPFEWGGGALRSEHRANSIPGWDDDNEIPRSTPGASFRN